MLLNPGILAFMLRTGFGTRPLRRRRFTLPLGLVAVAGALWLRSIPTSAGDTALIGVLGIAGVLLGLGVGALMKVHRADDDSLVTASGTSYAAVWTAVIGGRLLFGYGADHWFAGQIVDLSRTLGVDGSAAGTSAFVIMALSMVAALVDVTAFRAARVTGCHRRAEHPGVLRRPAALTSAATPTPAARRNEAWQSR